MLGRILTIQREGPVDWGRFIWSDTHRVVYGPVPSRRLGSSLGINLFPGRKMCSFGCIYCDCGPTVRRKGLKEGEYVPGRELIRKIKEGLLEVKDQDVHIDFITFSGNGESTLHPDFPEIAEAVARFRNRIFPAVPLAIFTNGVHLDRRKVREALKFFDLPIVKLDAPDQKGMEEINRPGPSFTIAELLGNFHSLPRVCLSTAVIPGPKGNVGSLKSEEYLKIIEEVDPIEVHLYSFDYPTFDHDLYRASEGLMLQIAKFIATSLPFTVKVISRRNPHPEAPPLYKEGEILRRTE